MYPVNPRHAVVRVRICSAFLVGACALLSAQVPGALSPPAAPAPVAAADPLGRDTPFGTVTGFSRAVRRDDFTLAARYLQPGGRSAEQAEDLSRDLNDLIERYFTQAITSLSLAPTGDFGDGLDPDRERLLLTIGDKPVEIFLTRVTDPAAGPIWLFASDSLARVPALRRSAYPTWVERVMPASLVTRSVLGFSIAQWILWALSILAPLLLFWLLILAVGWVGRRRIQDLTHRAVFTSWWRSVRLLLVTVLTLVAHLAAMRLFGFSLRFRVAYARAGLFVAVIVGALLVWRVVSVTFHQAQLLAARRGRSDTRSLIQLGARVAKVVVVLIAIFGLLALAGVDMTTALAGVGILGVAVALGAQKTVENLLGGIFLLTDKALAVGDYCRLLDREGWIEDVTLRSVRLRTVEQTLLSVPAGLLSQGSIENFASRTKILTKSLVRLRYGTTREQLEAVLDGVRQLLATHPSIDRETARIRLIAFGSQAIELELFAYITTADASRFLEIRESLLVQVARIVESSGTAFALPTDFIQLRSRTEES